MACGCAFADNPKFQTIARWTILGLSILAWIFSVVTLASCTFTVVSDATGLFFSGDLTYGLFSADTVNTNGCESYKDLSDFKIESGHAAGRAFGVLTNLFLVAAIIAIPLLYFLPLLRDNEKWSKIIWMSVRGLFIASFLTNLFTFSFRASLSDLCDISALDCKAGAAAAMASLNVWILIALITLSWLVPSNPDEPLLTCGASGRNKRPVATAVAASQPQQQPNYSSNVSATTPPPTRTTTAAESVTTRTEQIMEDGTKKVIEETTHPNGRKTITETFEEVVDINDNDNNNNGRPYDEYDHDDDDGDDDDEEAGGPVNVDRSSILADHEAQQQQPPPHYMDQTGGAPHEDEEEVPPNPPDQTAAYTEETIAVTSDAPSDDDEFPEPSNYDDYDNGPARGADPPGEAEFAPSLISTNMHR